MKQFLVLLLIYSFTDTGWAQIIRRPIPDKVVVLTFDDASSTHATVVAPMLKKYGFGGTFFVCEFPPDFADKTKYMSWEQIRELNRMGFEVANHTLSHKHVNKLSPAQFTAELDSLEARCRQYGIPKPISFAYPAYDTDPSAFDVLRKKGYQLARIGNNRAYEPLTDHPYLIPSHSTTGTDKERVLNALRGAEKGKIVVLTVHGVPDYAHDWVTTPPALFSEYMQYLHDNQYTVIALRDLATYINVPEASRTIPLPTH